MPTITPADALIRAADDLTDALTGIVPPPNLNTGRGRSIDAYL